MCQLSWYCAAADELNGGAGIRDAERETEIMIELERAEEIGKQLLEKLKEKKKCQK